MRRFTLLFIFALSGALAALPACPDPKPKYPTCAGDEDCKDGEHCIGQMCRQCGSDAHCPGGQTCEKGACVRPAGYCEDDRGCRADQVCIENRCQSCSADSECGPGGRCDAGRCIRGRRCNVDSDCDDDEDCVDGVCQQPWKSEAPPELTCTLAPVYFSFDSSAIDKEARDGLNQTLECIRKSAANKMLYLVGHTDPRGTEEYNIALSDKRANAVADYLARLGIDPVRLRVVPKGEAEASGIDESSWQKDRRCDIQWR